MKTHGTYEIMPNVLIVNDTPENLRLLANILKDTGYQIRLLWEGRMVFLL